MPHLVKLVEELRLKKIGFKSNIFSSLAQFERRLIQERTRAGLEAARSRGKNGGRKRIESTNPKVLTAKNMHTEHDMSIDDICKTLKISRSSFYRYLGV
jgi:DNA invertase Pin-like site-specific DNA recombinase